mmetsp:Transcript_17223/g.48055  ORF Transcript_17223/g.48055 Transcript_17223/m.48055 type:complete len:164 (+) Transcript_17223:90-581(+)
MSIKLSCRRSKLASSHWPPRKAVGKSGHKNHEAWTLAGGKLGWLSTALGSEKRTVETIKGKKQEEKQENKKKLLARAASKQSSSVLHGGRSDCAMAVQSEVLLLAQHDVVQVGGAVALHVHQRVDVRHQVAGARVAEPAAAAGHWLLQVLAVKAGKGVVAWEA